MFTLSSPVDFDFTLENPTETLVAGFAAFGLAGLTAADYLVSQLDLSETGHMEVEMLPAITPFSNGRPRHHTRLYSQPELDITLLVGELFVPPTAAEPLSESILTWMADNGVEEIVVLSGVPTPHGPDDHRAFYIASEDYYEAHLTDSEIPSMGGGFLDGVNGALLQRSIDSPLRACVLTTPVHAQVPDVEAALRLITALDSIYGLEVDTGPLEEFAAQVTQHYEELAARLADQQSEGTFEDRMFM